MNRDRLNKIEEREFIRILLTICRPMVGNYHYLPNSDNQGPINELPQLPRQQSWGSSSYQKYFGLNTSLAFLTLDKDLSSKFVWACKMAIDNQ
jgi:hypothetical protein